MNSEAEPKSTETESRISYLNDLAAKRIAQECYPTSWFWKHPPADSYPNERRVLKVFSEGSA